MRFDCIIIVLLGCRFAAFVCGTHTRTPLHLEGFDGSGRGGRRPLRRDLCRGRNATKTYGGGGGVSRARLCCLNGKSSAAATIEVNDHCRRRRPCALFSPLRRCRRRCSLSCTHSVSRADDRRPRDPGTVICLRRRITSLVRCTSLITAGAAHTPRQRDGGTRAFYRFFTFRARTTTERGVHGRCLSKNTTKFRRTRVGRLRANANRGGRRVAAEALETTKRHLRGDRIGRKRRGNAERESFVLTSR